LAGGSALPRVPCRGCPAEGALPSGFLDVPARSLGGKADRSMSELSTSSATRSVGTLREFRYRLREWRGGGESVRRRGRGPRK